MTRVLITVEDTLLGDVEVEQNDRVGSFNADKQRKAIRDQLALALVKISRAYELPPYNTAESGNNA